MKLPVIFSAEIINKHTCTGCFQIAGEGQRPRLLQIEEDRRAGGEISISITKGTVFHQTERIQLLGTS
jgi:hypothetical protein